jgi:hypothetical protein
VRGVLEAATYDALVPPPWRSARLLPGTASALLLASGGRSLFAAFRGSPEARLAADPLDAYTCRVAEGAAAALREEGASARALFAHRPIGGVFADFVALGRACGLGAPSRLGLLLHPTFGPWLSLRALVLCDLPLAPTSALRDFDPCPGCAAPCASACHGRALGGARFDTTACRTTRLREPACALRCDARRACVIGPEHAYDADAEAHHMRAAGVLAAG